MDLQLLSNCPDSKVVSICKALECMGHQTYVVFSGKYEAQILVGNSMPLDTWKTLYNYVVDRIAGKE